MLGAVPERPALPRHLLAAANTLGKRKGRLTSCMGLQALRLKCPSYKASALDVFITTAIRKPIYPPQLPSTRLRLCTSSSSSKT